MSEKISKQGKQPKLSTNAIMEEFGVTDSFIFNIIINQKAVIDNKFWNLTITHMSVFHAIRTIIEFGLTDTMNDKDGFWYNVPEHKIIKMIPMMGIRNRVSIYNKIVDLIEYDLIERNPDNKKGSRKWIRLGKNASLMVYQENRNID